MSLNTSLVTAGRTLEVFSAGVQVAGHNIANASTPGYIREELQLAAAPPYRRGALLLGTGVLALGVQQQIDLLLESRIHTTNSSLQASRTRETAFQQLEAELRELGAEDLSTSLNRFLGALQDLANQPELVTNRQLVIEQGRQLASDIQALRARLDDLHAAQDVQVGLLVNEANSLIDDIARLNPQIIELEAAGLRDSDAGALRTQRYDALNRLSEIIPIRFIERPDGSVEVFSGSDFLILGNTTQHLVTNGSGSVQSVELSETHAPLNASGGELRGVFDARDQIFGGFIDQLDQLAGALIFEFNRVHSSGEGPSAFTSVTAEARISDPAAALNAAGLAFTPAHGSFQLKVANATSGITQTTAVNVDLDGVGTDMTLDDLRAALDAIDGVSATITTQGRLQITADAGFEFRFADDTSGVLAALGINTFFTGSSSGDIGVNSALVADPGLLATSQGGGPADNRNALELAQFLDRPLAGLGGTSLDEFYNSAVGAVAQSSAAETAIADGLDGFRTSLQNQRDQFSGVSLDEEAIRLMQFQRAYQAAARVISTVDELLQTLLSV